MAYKEGSVQHSNECVQLGGGVSSCDSGSTGLGCVESQVTCLGHFVSSK